MSIEEYKQSVVEKSTRRIKFQSNYGSNYPELAAILNDFCDNGVSIITQWRKLSDETEIVSGKWDSQLVEYVVNSFNSMNDENLNSSTANGTTRNYRMSAESMLKSKIPQRMF